MVEVGTRREGEEGAGLARGKMADVSRCAVMLPTYGGTYNLRGTFLAPGAG